MKLQFKKLYENALAPTRGSEQAAGYDLYANVPDIANPNNSSKLVASGETAMIGTGIAVAIPDGYFGAIYARSGIATKQGLRPANCVGVIDSDYRGELIVALHNDSTGPKVIEKGERIAQLVIQPYQSVELEEVTDLSDTARGEGGFGSTGKN